MDILELDLSYQHKRYNYVGYRYIWHKLGDIVHKIMNLFLHSMDQDMDKLELQILEPYIQYNLGKNHKSNISSDNLNT
jgi:hypothetical protein